MYQRSQFRSVKMFRPLRGKSEKVFLHEYTDSDERRFERCVTECSHRIACSRRRFECRRCRGATCTQGLTGLRGPLAMPSRSHEAGDLVLNFFLLNIDRDRARLIHSRPVIIHAARFSLLHSSSSNLKFSISFSINITSKTFKSLHFKVETTRQNITRFLRDLGEYASTNNTK